MEQPSTSSTSSAHEKDVYRPRKYADVNVKTPDIFKEPQIADYIWTDMESYEWRIALGGGSYSEVFVARKRHSMIRKEYALKIAKPQCENSILKELKVLYHMGKHTRIIQFAYAMKSVVSRKIGLLLEMPSKETLEQVEGTLTDSEIQYCLHQVLEGLDYCHSKGIMHRDIKPKNVLVNLHRKRVYIIDWGSAEFYLPGKEYNLYVGSR